MIAQISVTLNIALVAGSIILLGIIIFGLSKLFRSVKCPHCGCEFFTGTTDWKIKCPKCNNDFGIKKVKGQNKL